MYDVVEAQSREAMPTGEVALSVAQRRVVCLALVERLREDGVEVIDLCVDRTHIHALCRFPDASPPKVVIPGLRRTNALQDGRDPIPRHLLGRAKKNASHVLRQKGMKAEGPLWGKRSKIVPIESRQHQLSVVRYIRSHVRKGAVLWSTLIRERRGRG